MGGYGRGGHFSIFTNHKGALQLGGLAEVSMALVSFTFSPDNHGPPLHSVICALIILPSAAVMLLLIFLLIF